MGYYDNGYPPYVSVGERRAKAERKLNQLRKKNPNLKPIRIAGQALATTWWGKSWNRNLERYADYSNRIGRGRSYARHGSILDLQLKAGSVSALVQGSSSQPYKIDIQVDKLSPGNWRHIRQACEGNFDSLSELLAGKFPTALQDLFFADGSGLFPTPSEIHFDCSCPDWASMCKHVAAALYGIGARLDEDPALFFTLRNIQIDDIITQTVTETTQALLNKSETQSDNVLEDVDLGDVFGIELDDLDVALPTLPPITPAPAAKKSTRKKVPPKKTAAKKTAPAKKTAVSKKAMASRTTIAASKKAPPPQAPAVPRTSQANPLDTQQLMAQLEREVAALERREAAAAQTGKGKKPILTTTSARPAQGTGTMQALLLKAVGKARKGKSIDQLQDKLGWTKPQVRTALRRATTNGLVEIVQPGVYRLVL